MDGIKGASMNDLLTCTLLPEKLLQNIKFSGPSSSLQELRDTMFNMSNFIEVAARLLAC